MYQKGWMYNMILPWLTGGIAALDLFIKDEIEREGEEEFPRDLPGTKGLIRLHKSYNSGFPFGFLKERPELVKGIPLAVTSAAAGALGAFMTKKGCLAQIAGKRGLIQVCAPADGTVSVVSRLIQIAVQFPLLSKPSRLVQRPGVDPG